MTSLHNVAKFKMEDNVSIFNIAGWNIIVYTKINNLQISIQLIYTYTETIFTIQSTPFILQSLTQEEIK